MSPQRSAPAPVAANRATPPRRARLAWLLPGLYMTLTITGLALQGRAGRSAGPAFGLTGGVVLSASIGVWSLLGALLAARRPSNPIGWLLSGTALVWAITELSFGYAAYGLIADPGSLPAAIHAYLLYPTTYQFFELGIALLILLFPDGRLPSQRWRPVLWTGLVATVALVPVVIMATDQGLIDDLGIRGSVQVDPTLGSILSTLHGVASLLMFVVLVASAASLLLRWRGARGETRQQLKWFVYANAPMPVGFGLLFSSHGQQRIPLKVAVVLLAMWGVTWPVAVAIAVLKYRLYAIDRIIHRTIVYGLLTAILGLGYGATVLLLGQALGRGQSSLAVAGATLATAAAFQPARRRVQDMVDRRFNRRRYDAAKTIERFSVRLRDQLDLDTLTTGLLAVVNQTMEPTSVSLWLRPPTPQRRSASDSTISGTARDTRSSHRRHSPSATP